MAQGTAALRDAGLGAFPLDAGRCEFLVWAPLVRQVEVRIGDRLVPLEAGERGYHRAVVDGVEPGAHYLYRLDGGVERPDPASRFQPRGVHGPSQIVDPRFDWSDGGWKGLSLERCVFYEIHAGAFTPEGTFDAIVPRLDELRELGITAIELMPVAQFPGTRNWGYDGTYPFAVQGSYGGPAGLKRLVDACHRRGLAVALDVVYNHLGPEGNYLREFGPYFADWYRIPWGEAINFDGPGSDEVRRYFIENALHWIVDFHVDALRLDALHAIMDASAQPFLSELAAAVRQEARKLGREVHLIAESDHNDSRLVRPAEEGGLGLDAQWNDDFHHSLHALLTGERDGYYQDFGRLDQLVAAFVEGYVYSGQYSAYRRRRHGNSSRSIPPFRFVVASQTHDQVGNRMMGERLGTLVPFEALKLAAGVVLLSPYVPLLFMGEEWGETAPFQYFVSHSDSALIEAVRRGRREEFRAFAWKGEPPDPQDEATFLRSRPDWTKRHGALREFYRALLALRAAEPALSTLSREGMEVRAMEGERVLLLRRRRGASDVFVAFNFGDRVAAVPLPPGSWQVRLNSAAALPPGPAEASMSVPPTGFVVASRRSVVERSAGLRGRIERPRAESQ